MKTTMIICIAIILLQTMVYTTSGEGTSTATLSVSCTIPEVPGLNAPLREETKSVQFPKETMDKTVAAVSEETASSLTSQNEEIIEDTSNYNNVLRTVYRR